MPFTTRVLLAMRGEYQNGELQLMFHQPATPTHEAGLTLAIHPTDPGYAEISRLREGDVLSLTIGDQT